MNRQVLAGQATQISRQIWASFPIQARRAFAMHQVLKLAMGDDVTSLGLALLKALDNAGIDGPISTTGKTVQDLQIPIRKNMLGTIKKYADVLGRIVASPLKSMPAEARDSALSAVTIFLLSRGLNPGSTFAAALDFVQKSLRNKAIDAVRSQKRYLKLQQGMTDDDVRRFMGNPQTLKQEIPAPMWNKAMEAVKRAPELQEDGEPRVYQYIQGLVHGLNKVEIAEQLGLSSPALEKWFRHPDRLDTLGEIFEDAYLYLMREEEAVAV